MYKHAGARALTHLVGRHSDPRVLEVRDLNVELNRVAATAHVRKGRPARRCLPAKVFGELDVVGDGHGHGTTSGTKQDGQGRNV